MPKDPILYAFFQEAMRKEEIFSLELFENENFWKELSQKERLQLANLFLQQAEMQLFSSHDPEEVEAKIVSKMVCAEEIGSRDCRIQCKSALIFYRYSVLFDRVGYLFLALEKLEKVQACEPDFFNRSSQLLRLKGKILADMGSYLSDSHYSEQALRCYEAAVKILSEENEGESWELHWDWAQAYVLCGRLSGEYLDFQKGLELFKKAEHPGCRIPHFYDDFGQALVFRGMLSGSPDYLTLAQDYFKKAVIQSEHSKNEYRFIHIQSWFNFLKTTMRLYFLTGNPERLIQSDEAFQEAILNHPQQAELWLYWGELFIIAGWREKDLQKIEKGLEKLTSSKVVECHPLRVSALLGKGIAILGFLIEDYNMIREGKKRIEEAMEAAPSDRNLLFSAGIVHLCCGLHLMDGNSFEKALNFFEIGLQQDPTAIENLYEMHQVYLAWGLAIRNTKKIKTALRLIERVAALRPACPDYLNDWGTALIRLRLMEDSETSPQGLARISPRTCEKYGLFEEAIDKFKKALAIREDLEFTYNLGCALILLGEVLEDKSLFEEAISLLSDLFEALPSIEPIRYHLALAHLHYGELAVSLEHIRTAVSLLEPMISQNKEDESVYSELGYAFLLLAFLTPKSTHNKGSWYSCQSEKYLMEAVKLGNPEANYNLARLYSLNGFFKKSVAYLLRAEKYFSLPPIGELMQDDLLEKLRDTSLFQEFVAIRK